MFANGNAYIGPFELGTMEGEEATMMYANGDVYKGEFAQGLRAGFGIQKNSTGEEYQGIWYAG